MWLTFGLLGLSICAVWIQPIQIRKQFDLSPWLLLFIGASASGLLFGYLGPAAIAALSLFGCVAYLATQANAKRLQKIVFGAITAILALALAMHRLPGFNNPTILSNAQLSTDATIFTQYANFDKGSVGLILLAFFCNRTSTISELLKLLKRTSLIAVASSSCVIATAIAIGYVRPDLKLSWSIPIFLAINLLFTVIAEEAFFRGFLQDRLAASLHRFRFDGHISVVFSTVLFGIAHIGGGANYVLLAMMGGFGYAYAFFLFRRIEAPIFIHFALNTVHFIGFTYPHLK